MNNSIISKKWFEDLDSSFPSFFTRSLLPSLESGFRHQLKEEDSYYHISLDVPGVDPKSIRIKMQEQNLFVSSSEEHKEGSSRYDRRVDVSFTIPSHVDGSKIEANVENGVLDIILPKTTTAQMKEIPVRSSASTNFLSKVKKQFAKESH